MARSLLPHLRNVIIFCLGINNLKLKVGLLTISYERRPILFYRAIVHFQFDSVNFMPIIRYCDTYLLIWNSLLGNRSEVNNLVKWLGWCNWPAKHPSLPAHTYNPSSPSDASPTTLSKPGKCEQIFTTLTTSN